MTDLIKLPKDRKYFGKFFASLKFKTGAEIGVEQGLFSQSLLKANPELKLYLIDPWKCGPNSFINNNGDIIKATQAIIDTFYESTVDRLKTYRNIFVIRKTSMDALKEIEDKSLDFVYIDANHHFDYVMKDIIEWSKKVRPGGIVSGHDYIMRPKNNRGSASYVLDVKLAVEAYANAHSIPEIYILEEDYNPSWFWVKQ